MKRNSDSVKNRGRSSKTAPVLTAKLKCKQAALQCIVLLGMLMLAPFAHAQTTWTGISDNGINFGTLPSGFSNQELLLEMNQPGVVDLLVSKSGFTDQFWDGPLTTANGVSGGNGGSGTWNNTTTNWTNFNGTVNAPWQSGFAIFAGSGGIVTLGDNINFTGMQFAINGYFITAGGTAFKLTATQTSDSAQALGTGDVTVTGGVLTADPQSINVLAGLITGSWITSQWV